MSLDRRARLALTLLLAIYGMRILLHPDGGSLMDLVDLPIHETGHLVFAPFGEFLQFAGGTLFQLIMPAAFIVYFAKREDSHAASVGLWWVAQNFWNISVYVRDARAQALPLVGGGEHDWAYMLGRLGLLRQDEAIGRAVWFVGAVVYAAAILWGLVSLAKPQAAETADLPGTA